MKLPEVTLQFGDLPVIEANTERIVLEIGKGNFLRLHVASVPHTVKVGDRLPLFTRVPYVPRN
jgi:hypothetical protein